MDEDKEYPRWKYVINLFVFAFCCFWTVHAFRLMKETGDFYWATSVLIGVVTFFGFFYGIGKFFIKWFEIERY